MQSQLERFEGHLAFKEAKIANLRLENRKLHLYLQHALKGTLHNMDETMTDSIISE